MSCSGGTAPVSRAMLTVGVCGGGRIGGGAEDPEEGELGLHPRGSLQSRLTQGRETPAHGPGTGACRAAGSPLSSIPSQAAQRKLRQASTNVKHWNVQMNRLMHPIGPGGRRHHHTRLPLFRGIRGLSEKIPQYLWQGETPQPFSLAER